LEYQGFLANIGIRLDYSNPNIEWPIFDTYSRYFGNSYDGPIYEVEGFDEYGTNPDTTGILAKPLPKEKVEPRIKISPRLGVSHPLSPSSKLYFNYGWFYSLPVSSELYILRYGSASGEGVEEIGNPKVDLPRTVAYELGFNQEIAGLFLFDIVGYYKDITNQLALVTYTNYTGDVDYSTYENQDYRDIRGFELTLEKRFGNWIRGFINYDYRVVTHGYIGRRHYYEDKQLERVEGLHDPFQEKSLPQPVLRANVRFIIPNDWGPKIGGINPLGGFVFSLLYSQRAGKYITWDPLETYQLYKNLQWKPEREVDVRIHKDLLFGGQTFTLYMEINNLFDTKYISETGFIDSDDRDAYYKSLHLPMYDQEEYQSAGFVAGGDKPGDIKSKNKPYIDMPNNTTITFFNPRSFSFGIRLSF
jgi:outer membrane receptor protein involved in Fe transport